MSGSPLFALIPLSAFVLFNVYFIGRDAGQVQNWRRVFVLSSIAWGVYVVLVGEVLSLFEAVTTLWLAIAWLVPTVTLVVLVRRSGAARVAWQALRNGVTRLSPAGKALLGATALICGVLLGVALISPPSNVDSALYHMSRVMHWAQNASLRPYPTIMEHQLHKPIWAESAILHMRVLWGNDTPANLVQWFSMVGSLVVVSGIAARLGGGRGAQLLAAAFAVSLPMGILQSTSTQNDYVAAFWAVCLAYLVVLSITRRLTGWELAALAASVGLSTLTKGTAFVYTPPFVAWFLIHELTARGIRRAFVAGISIAGIAVVLNAGFWARNVAVYGGPYGSSQWLQRNLWVRFLEEPSSSSLAIPAGQAVQATQAAVPIATAESLDPPATPAAAEPTPAAVVTPAPRSTGYLARLAQTAGRNLTLPTGFLSRPMIAALESIPGVFGKAYADEMRAVSWNSEDFAGNPLHLLFVPVSLALLLLSWRKPEAKFALAYSAVTLVTFAMIPIVIGHGPSIWGIRYQLSFFVLWAPVVGVAFGLVAKDRFLNILAAGFLLAALPWVLFNKSRPLIGLPPPRTVIGSILTENQAAMVLPWSPQLRDDYTLAAQAVLESGCTEVGLRADSDFLEYPLWWLLGAPQNGLRLESLETTSYLEPYVDPAFTPCAVVCANCLEGETPEGLALIGSFDSLNVFGAAE
ncbi:MAG: 2 protein [Anaerolineales bacterium]|nr:2 protein [Anaerolineales bacterium]